MRSKASNSPSKACVGSKTYKVSSQSNVAKYRRQKLIKELDKYTSLICRIKSADAQGFSTCYTCGKRDYWRNFDCGHYVKRSYQHTRWLQEDVRSQCRVCLTGEAELYLPDFSPIKQKDVKPGDMILARNPLSNGVMIVEIEKVKPIKVNQTKVVKVGEDKVEGTLDHRIETTTGFSSIENIKKDNIITIWKK